MESDTFMCSSTGNARQLRRVPRATVALMTLLGVACAKGTVRAQGPRRQQHPRRFECDGGQGNRSADAAYESCARRANCDAAEDGAECGKNPDRGRQRPCCRSRFEGN